MAILGHGREEIVKSLREELGIEDREPLERVGIWSPRSGYGAGQRPSPVRSKVSIRVSLAKTA